jgi:hypothetical protein
MPSDIWLGSNSDEAVTALLHAVSLITLSSDGAHTDALSTSLAALVERGLHNNNPIRGLTTRVYIKAGLIPQILQLQAQ